MAAADDSDAKASRRELRAFLFLTVVLFPVLAVLTVAGFGLLVWIWQIFNGTPGA